MSASIDSSHFPKCGAKIKILLYNANIFYLFFCQHVPFFLNFLIKTEKRTGNKQLPIHQRLQISGELFSHLLMLSNAWMPVCSIP